MRRRYKTAYDAGLSAPWSGAAKVIIWTGFGALLLQPLADRYLSRNWGRLISIPGASWMALLFWTLLALAASELASCAQQTTAQESPEQRPPRKEQSSSTDYNSETHWKETQTPNSCRHRSDSKLDSMVQSMMSVHTRQEEGLYHGWTSISSDEKFSKPPEEFRSKHALELRLKD